MNLKKFPVATTNIFPLANSDAGGQLLSEWNIRSRETVGTSSAVLYEIGPSYAHSMQDLALGLQEDAVGTIISSTELVIHPGRALVNGHFIESLADISIDMLERNTWLEEHSQAPLVGKLGVGLKAFYSTQATMAGAMTVEEDEVYTGIQVIILPVNQLTTPDDVPNQEGAATCDLKLGTFEFTNGAIRNIFNDPAKLQYVGSDRIRDIESGLSTTYISKAGLNPKNLYVFSGKSTSSTQDTWCVANDSLIVWDTSPQTGSTAPSTNLGARFIRGDDQESFKLILPHKQVDGMLDENGNPQYYQDKVLYIPTASYSNNTAGVVTKSYTKNIKNLESKLSNIYHLAKGKQVYYLSTLSSTEDLPSINTAWDIGDYVLVRTDYTVDADTTNLGAPSTIYAVLPGYVQSLNTKIAGIVDNEVVPDALTGVELEEIVVTADPGAQSGETLFPDYSNFRGQVTKDYFVARYEYEVDDTSHFRKYYYSVKSSSLNEWSEAIQLTGTIPFAQETTVGGFLNSPDDYTDGGYVYLDSSGYLRLRDYSLLRAGTLAYQLGESIDEFGNGESLSSIQETLDEVVNDRIAFPSEAQIKTSNTPNVIEITINLSDDERESDEDTGIRNLYIRNIDSRFNTSVYFHFTGDATNKTIINFVDCERIRIDSNICGSVFGDGTAGPIINVYRCGLYYDSAVLNYIKTCDRPQGEYIYYDFGTAAIERDAYPSWFTGMKDIKLWYQRYSDEDPNLTVDGMTVKELDVAVESENFDFWTPLAPNDNHYSAALSSVSFASDGTIIGCGLLVSNQSTENVQQTDSIIVTEFSLPAGQGLTYPESCMTRKMKVTGTFTSAYYTNAGWYVTETAFTAFMNAYNDYIGTSNSPGSIALHEKTTIIQSDFTEGQIPAWESDTYNLFYGGIVSASS